MHGETVKFTECQLTNSFSDSGVFTHVRTDGRRKRR